MSGEPPPHLKVHYSIADLVMGILDSGSLLFIAFGLIYLLFSARFALFGAVLISQIIVVLWSIWQHILARTRPIYLRQVRNRILIGSATTTILSIVPRVSIHVLTAEYSWLLWYICLTSPVTIVSTWFFFVRQSKDRCKVFYDFDDIFLKHVFKLNLIQIVYGISSSFKYTDGFWQILICQLWFSVIGAASMTEFYQAARWKIKWISEEDPISFEEQFTPSQDVSQKMPGVNEPHLKLRFSISDWVIVSSYIPTHYIIFPIVSTYLLCSAQLVLSGAVVVSITFVWLSLKNLRYYQTDRIRPIDLKPFRNYILFGSTLTTILSIIPRVYVHFLGAGNSWFLWYISLTFSMVIGGGIWPVLVSQLKDRCEIFYEVNDSLLRCVNYANLLLFIYGIFSSFSHTEGFWLILFCQVLFSVIGAASMAELCQVARWKIKLIPEEDPIDSEEQFSPSQNMSQTENSFLIQ